MGTARERLFQALEALLQESQSVERGQALMRLLKSYRVQAKPGEKTILDTTARDMLFAAIVELWKSGSKVTRPKIAEAIAPFRMQLKQGLGRGKLIDVKDGKSESKSSNLEELSNRHRRKETYERIENAFFADRVRRDDHALSEAVVSGGPKKKNLCRSQCPKCRSLGLVLAKAYGDEDYISCIYCGFQSHLDAGSLQIDLPSAAEMVATKLGSFNPDGEE